MFAFVFAASCLLQRADTVVYDEPLYAHFLRTNEEVEKCRPYVDEVFKQQVLWKGCGQEPIVFTLI